MSTRFVIKNRVEKIEKEGNVIVRYTGNAEPFERGSERESRLIGVDGGGNPRLIFNTGLDEKKVEFFKWYTEEEKERLVKEIQDLKPHIEEYYGGKNVIDEANAFFWKMPEVNKIKVTNENIDVIFDTKQISAALLYLSIASGAFIDTIAPTKDWAERFQLPHYMLMESEDIYLEDDVITRSDAHAALGELRKDSSSDSLFILAWCLQYDTNAYGAYLKSTSVKELVTYNIQYIDGKLKLKKKRDTAKLFLDYFNKWNSPKLRPLLYIEAYVKSGEYYNFIQKKDKKYVFGDTVLGGTINEAVETLSKTKYSEDLQGLKKLVEDKWNS